MMAMAALRPKSPPSSPDPCGRHRLQLAVDTLHREIGFLEGEINSIEGVHAASKCCKEVDEFVGKNVDPFITISVKKGNTGRSPHLPKKFRDWTCLSYLSWMCCCGGCSTIQIKGPSCCCSCGALERLCRCCCSAGRCGFGCRGCGGCTSPRCLCGCTCSCPSPSCCSSCACPPTSCGAGCCAVSRCRLCS